LRTFWIRRRLADFILHSCQRCRRYRDVDVQANYQLGSDAAEIERLNLQGRVLAPATRTILEAAGIRPRMRVLDLGCGAGDVAFVAADLVGPEGEVVGIDRAREPIAKANQRASHQGVENVRFVTGDIHDTAPDGPFDAIVGRLVLTRTVRRCSPASSGPPSR
jgi:protein-L-isoaspartate O-methyltransferase